MRATGGVFDDERSGILVVLVIPSGDRFDGVYAGSREVV